MSVQDDRTSAFSCAVSSCVYARNKAKSLIRRFQCANLDCSLNIHVVNARVCDAVLALRGEWYELRQI